MNCYVDLHMYSFPYENAIENIEYIIDKHNVLYLGEYAKHSDSSYINDMDSKMYFISGLWGSYFYNLTYTPMHWWWEETLNDSDYLALIDIYNLISGKLDTVKKVEKINLLYKIYGELNTFNQSEKNKIKERLGYSNFKMYFVGINIVLLVLIYGLTGNIMYYTNQIMVYLWGLSLLMHVYKSEKIVYKEFNNEKDWNHYFS